MEQKTSEVSLKQRMRLNLGLGWKQGGGFEKKNFGSLEAPKQRPIAPVPGKYDVQPGPLAIPVETTRLLFLFLSFVLVVLTIAPANAIDRGGAS